MRIPATFLSVLLLSLISAGQGRIAFEKLTDMDYRGSTYYTIRNLSLYECQGWCREEPDCAAASFSFVVNPLAPIQETVCLLQNDTAASNPSVPPQRSVSTYYMTKLNIRSENVCNRPWNFERVPNKILRGLDNALIFTSTKEACLAACLNERRFVCRSAEYNYVTLQCHLSEHDRRSVEEFVELIDAQGVDYFENLCLKPNEACKGSRQFASPPIGVAEDRIAQHVAVHYYVDKEILVNNEAGCQRACQVESEFLCRSYLYFGNDGDLEYNCQLFHLDHKTLPDGPSTFLATDRPLLDNGAPIGRYIENSCEKPRDRMVCKQIRTKDKRYVAQIMCYEKPVARQNDDPNAPVFVQDVEDAETIPAVPAAPSVQEPSSNTAGSSSSGSGSGSSSGPGSSSGSGSSSGTSGSGSIQSPNGVASGSNSATQQDDINCDRTGTCYDVTVHCRDTKIEVQVKTNRPFNGRIYALGRSETCNVDVINSDAFRLDLSMTGQDCNTQSMNGMFSNTVVLQHHSVVMTKGDKIYKVKCTYDMSPRNVSFGMMPIRDPDMISITSAPEAPPPRIRIVDPSGRDVETVRIGDRLVFRVEIPGDTPYGIFARSCFAMAKDSRSTFQIIDDDGCPVDPSIFPRFVPDGNALQSTYEAFRFTESYGVIFQCNVRYCLGPCEPAQCPWGRETMESWGRRRRAVSSKRDSRNEDDMNISQEILVLDLGDEDNKISKQTFSRLDSTPPQRNGSFANIHEDSVTIYNSSCPTKTSVLALSVTCALLLLMYVCTVFYLIMRRWSSPDKHV